MTFWKNPWERVLDASLAKSLLLSVVLRISFQTAEHYYSQYRSHCWHWGFFFDFMSFHFLWCIVWKNPAKKTQHQLSYSCKSAIIVTCYVWPPASIWIVLATTRSCIFHLQSFRVVLVMMEKHGALKRSPRLVLYKAEIIRPFLYLSPFPWLKSSDQL